MPKGTVKKKRYNARFPPARIKKIMQMDEEVGKVAAAVPVIISRALEMFIESLVTETSKVTQAKNAKTLSTSHIKQTITGTKQFDFLHDLVKYVPDHQTEDNGETSIEREPSAPKRGRGRPKATDSVKKSKPRGNKSSSEEEDEDDDNDAEDTETDEEATNGGTSYSETYNKESPADRTPNASFLPPDVQPSVSYPSGFNQSVQQPGMKPNIDQLIQAASSLQQQQQYLHSPLQPPVCDIALSHNNNNDNNFNYAPPSAFGSASHPGLSVIRDSLISGNNIAPLLHHQSLPLSAPCVLPPPPSSFPQPKQSMYQMPSNFDSPQSSLFSLQLPSKVSFNNSSSNALSNPPYLQSPVSQKLSQQQHQPVDLSHPLKQITKEEDDYDT